MRCLLPTVYLLKLIWCRCVLLVWVKRVETGGRGRRGSNLYTSDQEYRMRNMSTMEQKTEIFMFSVALTCTHILCAPPCSVTWQVLRKQTESRRSVNDTEVLPNPPARGWGSGALSCPAHPRDARWMLAFWQAPAHSYLQNIQPADVQPQLMSIAAADQWSCIHAGCN